MDLNCLGKNNIFSLVCPVQSWQEFVVVVALGLPCSVQALHVVVCGLL